MRPDALALMLRKDADRPHGDDRVGGDGRLARRDVTDHLASALRRERERGQDVARLPQRFEQRDFGRNGAGALRRTKARSPKGVGVDAPGCLEVLAPLRPHDHG
jgi:hypothetical protein